MNLERSPIAKKSKGGRPPKNVSGNISTINVSPTSIEVVTNEMEEEILDIGFDIDPSKSYVFEVIKKTEAFRLENLGSRGRVYDPNQKRYREIRYLAMAPTIFVEEQHESYDELADVPLMFNRNVLVAQGADRRLMEYLMLHELNESSPFRLSNKPPMYRLMDKEAQEAIRANRNAMEMKAIDAVKNSPIEDLQPVARVMFNIKEDSEIALRNTLYDLAKKEAKGLEKSNAEKILDNLDNPNLQRRFYIQQAIDEGIIFVNKDKGRACWADDTFICNMLTSSPEAIVNELTKWSFTDDGRKWYSQLRNKI